MMAFPLNFNTFEALRLGFDMADMDRYGMCVHLWHFHAFQLHFHGFSMDFP